MEKRLFCDKWEFAECPLGTEYDSAEGWQAVDIPHDWLISDTRALYRDSTGWYRRTLRHTDDGLRTALRFDGVYMDCSLYVNGVRAGEWKNGYTSFQFDISELLREGDNFIVLRADHRSPNSRWYSGAGIYRNVWLCRYPDIHILPDGVYISADTKGRVTVTTEAERPENADVNGLTVHSAVYDDGRLLAETEYYLTAADKSLIPPHLRREGCKYSVNTQVMNVPDPVLWDITAPKLYTCKTELKQNGEVIDSAEVRFGLRSAEFTPDKGFLLNGKRVKLHGCCEHHDLGALGAAVNRAALARKLKKLRSMGVNAVRTTHNPPAPELMELADEMGFLVLSEFTDVWEISKTEYDYARFSKEWRERDIAQWVRRDRNSPSLIGWSIGNEIPDTAADAHGQEITSLIAALVRRSDPRGNAVVTIGSNQMRTENGRKCADILKVAGYNYSEELYESHHAAHPDWCIYGSETSSILSSRGVYHFPLSQQILSEEDCHCSSLGNSRPIWAARNHEYCILPDRDLDFCAGQFIWSGFDYIGETYPYDTNKNCCYGQFDTAGFEKDGAFVFRSVWTDCKSAPMVHIFPHWSFNEGELIDVRVASNTPLVKLYLNGTLVKEQRFDRAHGREILLDARIPFVKGELLAVGCDEDGRELARDVKRSFGDTAYLEALPDKTVMRADGRDMIFIEAAAYDKDGNFAADANDRVTVTVGGAARLAGLDNGDPSDLDRHSDTSRRLFSGRLLIMLMARDRAGEITVTLSSPNTRDVTIHLRAESADVPDGISFMRENVTCGGNTEEIPVRKIELSGERRFSPDRRQIRIDARLFPANATYRDIEYRLTSVNGIPSQNALITESGSGGVTVEALGDGEIYLRALCRNGRENGGVMSVMRLECEGLGSPFRDPYELIEAGTFELSGGDVLNGIDHGVRFIGSGYFGIKNIDFGALGSDRITLPVFADTHDTVRLKVYDGTPDEGELIGVLEYRKSPKWLEYQPETYTLTKRLCGVHTVSIESEDKLDVGGIVFVKTRKESSELPASLCESVRGDSFLRDGNTITDIGNNVIIDFGEFNFGSESPTAVVINGRSEIARNSIELMFEGGTEKRVICEFAGADDYTERRFPLEGISGKVNVSLVFLPGCRFDLGSIRFVSE